MYIELSGANNNYGFFAPSVASQILAEFEIQDSSGKVIKDTLRVSNSAEVSLRVNTMLIFFRIKEGQDVLCRSWAAMKLSDYENANKVRIYIKELFIPSMISYSRGAKIYWRPIYQADFLKQ